MSRRRPDMLTLYYGSDGWRLRQAAMLFADVWRASHGAGPLIVHGDDAATSVELEGLLKYPSLFGQRSCAVVHGPLSIATMGDLVKIRTDDTDILMVQRIAQKQTVQEKKALSGFVKAADTVATFEPLTGADLAAWVRTFTAGQGRTIEPAAVAELTGRGGNETWNLANELEKLCAYSPQTISVEAVRLLVPIGQKMDEWELSNAILARDIRATVVALFRRVAQGAPTPLLLGNVASAVRTLLMVRDLTDRGQAPAAIAKATGLHPYVVVKTIRGAAQYRPDRLKAAHRMLSELDRATKDGRADAIDGLFSIILAL